MQSAHACACFVEVALFSKKYEKVRNWTQKGAILDYSWAGNRLKNDKNRHLGALGCKMEGPGPFWGAKWRGKAPFRVQNGGSGSRLGCKMEGPSTVVGTALAHWIRRASPWRWRVRPLVLTNPQQPMPVRA